MKKTSQFKPSDLVAHRDTMLLIDEIDISGDDWIECLVHHNENSPFADQQGNTPSWLSLEYMCQTIAALEGSQRLAKNKEIAIGFVLGTKCLQTQMPYFHRNQTIRVRVDEEMKNQTSLGVYACKILGLNREVLARARIKAIMPKDPNSIIHHLSSINKGECLEFK